MPEAFRGWPTSALDFFRDLEQDNTRAFWTAHKDVYERDVRAPFEALSELVAEEFGPLQLFRPYRDVRFSKDKSPYKTRAYAATEGEGGEAYYVEVSAKGLVVASGYWMMANDQLDRYRRAVDDDRTGAELERIVAGLAEKDLTIEGHALKTAPRGYRRDHPRIELLRRTSVAVMQRFDPGRWLSTATAADNIVEVWRAAGPMNVWLAQHVGPSTAPPPDGRY
jgi:uncharacterized protein (TIGR02453 family)